MAYDTELANRVREALAGEPDIHERSMFGALAFMANGNLAVGASGQGGLMLRVDPADTASLLEQEHVEPFVMRGRAVAGWLRIDPLGVDDDDTLARWVARGVTYARSLPGRRRAV